MLSTFRWRECALCLLLCTAALAAPTAAQVESMVELANGIQLGPGIAGETESISTNAFQRGGNGGVSGKPIVYLDDGYRYTFFNGSRRNMLPLQDSTAPALEEFKLPSAAEAISGVPAPGITGFLGITEFNKYGRRVVGFATHRGPYKVLQGITLLTPTYAKLEILNWDGDKFAWDSRIATSTIPADKLREILLQNIDEKNSSDWLRLTSFYIQAQRYYEARQILEEGLNRFPSELADRRAILTQLDQLESNQKFAELRLRRDAGQHRLAAQYLGAFPIQLLPVETQVTLKDELVQLQKQISDISEITAALKEHVARLPEPDQQVVAPIVEELMNEISFETVARLADFQRLRRDDSLPNENKVALALSGWILGAGSGLDNFAVVKSLLRVRTLVTEYLNDAPAPRRQVILSQLASEEGAQPELLDKLLEVMKPPQPLPTANVDDTPGLFRLSATTSKGERVEYVVQTPPEYDPQRKYPCVLAIPGRGESQEMEINWWCGPEITLPSGGKMRSGHATRYGYIVVSPAWMTEKQSEYEYTEDEHDRILCCLRDANRKLSIDTDRVFVSGHYDGATAAWDLALSHPDLWAGAIMISPEADKYIVQYSENVQAKSGNAIPLGTYIVYGSDDPTRTLSKMSVAANRYLTSPSYDSLVVEYKGRGRERFVSELPRIMEWMQLSSHRRVRTPKEIETRTMRPGDRFFYWLEAPTILAKAAGNPIQFDPSSYGVFEARLLDPSTNGVTISKIASENRSAVVWLTPDMVSFSRQITINMSGKRQNLDLSPDISIMLEDVRTRSDRMHVFWQRVIIE